MTTYEAWNISLYNTIMTALPIIVHAVYDFDHNYKWTTIKNAKDFYPSVYYVGQQWTIFNMQNIFTWLMEGFSHSVFAFMVSLYFFQNEPITESG